MSWARFSSVFHKYLPLKLYSQTNTDSLSQSRFTNKYYLITPLQLRNIVADRMRYDSLLVRYNALIRNNQTVIEPAIEAATQSFDLADQNARDFSKIIKLDTKTIKNQKFQIIWLKVRAPLLGVALFYLGNKSVTWGWKFW